MCVRARQGRGATAPKGGRFRESLGRFPTKFSKLDVISSFLPNLDTFCNCCVLVPEDMKNELSTRYKIWFILFYLQHTLWFCVVGLKGERTGFRDLQ